jgi:hypothetical protein
VWILLIAWGPQVMRRKAGWLACVWTLTLLGVGGVAAATDDGLGAAPNDATSTLGPCFEEVIASPPRCPWHVRAEAIMLFRDAEGNMDAAALGNAQNVLLSTRDLDNPFKAGPKVFIGRTLNDRWQFEMSYFDLAQWNASASVRDAGSDLLSPLSHFGNPISAAYDHNDFISLQYKSYLNNVEMNLRYTVDTPPGRMTTSFLLGARYVGLNEDLQFYSEGTGGNHFAQSNVDNELWGVQIGGLFEFFVQDDWWINFEMKGAICQNSTTLTNSFTSVDVARRNTSAFIGEIDLTCVHRWGNHLSTRVGYQAMWLDHVALASDNFNSNIDFFAAGPPQINNHGTVVYHGPHVGIELIW